jgi:hypothetical protein
MVSHPLLLIYISHTVRSVPKSNIKSADRGNILNIHTVKPAYAVTCIKSSPFSCPVIENFIWNEPFLRGHLSYKATFSLSHVWSDSVWYVWSDSVWYVLFFIILSLASDYTIHGIHIDILWFCFFLSWRWNRYFLVLLLSWKL